MRDGVKRPKTIHRQFVVASATFSTRRRARNQFFFLSKFFSNNNARAHSMKAEGSINGHSRRAVISKEFGISLISGSFPRRLHDDCRRLSRETRQIFSYSTFLPFLNCGHTWTSRSLRCAFLRLLFCLEHFWSIAKRDVQRPVSKMRKNNNMRNLLHVFLFRVQSEQGCEYHPTIGITSSRMRKSFWVEFFGFVSIFNPSDEFHFSRAATNNTTQKKIKSKMKTRQRRKKEGPSLITNALNVICFGRHIKMSDLMCMNKKLRH